MPGAEVITDREIKIASVLRPRGTTPLMRTGTNSGFRTLRSGSVLACKNMDQLFALVRAARSEMRSNRVIPIRGAGERMHDDNGLHYGLWSPIDDSIGEASNFRCPLISGATRTCEPYSPAIGSHWLPLLTFCKSKGVIDTIRGRSAAFEILGRCCGRRW